ncbi:hypothetical protein [Salsuginibacillus kocurii]|uniref:YkvI family membrane protein n=1 Tax=Salsuginibacillus kocurii TaxID=427078 RepID=UPI0003759ED3|nr:hypothetical protein [Salsuginibacillus kocurii]
MVLAGFKWMFLIIGTMIGAGYASGREIWQFFSGESSLAIGLFALLFMVCLLVVMTLSYTMHTNDYIGVLERIVGRRMSHVYDLLTVLYLFTTTGTMIAGGAAALEMFHLPYWAGILFISVMLVWVLRYDVEGVTSINVFMIPVLIVTLLITLLMFQWSVGGSFQFEAVELHSMSPVFVFTALNLLPIVAVIAGVGSRIRSHGEIWIACCGSSLILGVVTYLYNESLLAVSDDVLLYEIPLFAILNAYPYVMVLFMTLLLWTAIFTTAATGLFGLVRRLRVVSPQPTSVLAVFSLLAMLPLAWIGFSTLVSTLYPIYGVINLYLLAAVVLYPLLRRIGKK